MRKRGKRRIILHSGIVDVVVVIHPISGVIIRL